MRCKCGLFLALCFWVLLVPTVAKAKVKPKRVAVISSSGVNNDFRSWNEYDGTLQHLGWHFEKLRNTELGKSLNSHTDKTLSWQLLFGTTATRKI